MLVSGWIASAVQYGALSVTISTNLAVAGLVSAHETYMLKHRTQCLMKLKCGNVAVFVRALGLCLLQSAVQNMSW